jgi:hypothetical protein
MTDTTQGNAQTAQDAPPELTPEEIFAQAQQPGEGEGDEGATGEGTADAAAAGDDTQAQPQKPAYNRDSILRKKEIARLNQTTRQLQEELKAVKEKHEASEALRAKLADPALSYNERVHVMRQLGVDLDALNESLLRDAGVQTDDKGAAIPKELQKEIEENRRFRAELERKAQAEAEAKAKADRDAEQAQYYSAAKKFVDENADKYPLIDAMGKSGMIWDEITRLEAEGELDPDLTINQVADVVEAKIEEQIGKELKVLLGKEKFKKLLNTLNGAAPADNKNKPSKARATLTNRLGQAPKDDFDYSKATQEEIEQHALDALKVG